MALLRDEVRTNGVGQTVTADDLPALDASTNPFDFRSGPGDLLLSNSPERITTNNRVLFHSPVGTVMPSVANQVRLFLHHLNDLTMPPTNATIKVVLKNPTGVQATVTRGWTGSGMSTNAVPALAGKTAVGQYLAANIPDPSTIQIPLLSTVDLEVWSVPPVDTTTTSVISAVMDIETDTPLDLYVTVGNPDLTNPNDYADPAAGHERSTFSNWDILKGIVYGMTGDPQAARMGDTFFGGDPIVPIGTDYTKPNDPRFSVENKGSYGMRYIVTVSVDNTPNPARGLGAVINPRGGKGSFGGAVRDVTAGTRIFTPASGTIPPSTNQAVIISKQIVPASGTATRTFYFIPPGGSPMPVALAVTWY
jgi:hypothetical protein